MPLIVRVVNRARSSVLAERCSVATTLRDRVVGLLGRDSLESGEGLWIHPCSSIHMLGMKFPIDAVFLDRNHRVVKLAPHVRPGQLCFCLGRAKSVLELPIAVIEDSRTQAGDPIEFQPLERGVTGA